MEFGTDNLIFMVIFIIAMVYLTINAIRLISYLQKAKPENRLDNIPKRIMQTLTIAIFQKKILRDKVAGPIHAGIFWGFLILLFSALNSIFTGLGIEHAFNFLGPVFSVITVLTDLFCLAIIVAVAGALYRRYVKQIKRLPKDPAEKLEAGLILVTIFFIVTALLFENSAAIAMGTDASWAFRPISMLVAGIIPVSAAPIIHGISFWVHIVLILAFMNYLPFSKHLHVLTSVPNVFLATIGPANALERIDFEDESLEQYGVSDVEDFKWKALLDGYSCTHCGRCTSVCPANITGKVLDPREIIVQTRERTIDKMPILKLQDKLNGNSNGESSEEVQLSDEQQAILDKKFIGDYQNFDALWQCTTCGACMQECPVSIEHVPAIIEMRRSLVMMESEFPSELQSAFGSMETNGTPWAFSPSERADWAEGLGINQAAEKQEFDVLFWVGCSGSFDDRAKKVSVAFSKLMQKAGVDFAILGTEEQCNGDVARRTGNEYLADSMVQMNIETMNQYKFNRIVATCPHCFNTLKNEFPQFGGKYDVVHHTQYIMELVKDGKLKFADTKAYDNIAYHDSCYMGRYNDVYEEPRNSLKSVPGMNVIDPKRSRDKGLCCGAGGGQMFMEENQGKRVNIERTEELISTGAKTIAVNCPFCMTMISDGVKMKDADDVQVKDVSEILLESMENGDGK